MPVTYERLNPADYAARRLALRLKVQEGATVEAAARVLNIPRSTARLWAAQDGFRLMDLTAEERGAPRPEVGDWAKPGRGKAPAPAAGEDGLPPADYPELKGLGPRQRLEALARLADTADMRAVAAIEEGCIAFGLASLREAQRLRRAWRALQDWLERYPAAEEHDPDDWRHTYLEELLALEAPGEGRAPQPPQRAHLTPEQAAEAAMKDEIWRAIEDAQRADTIERYGDRPLTQPEMEAEPGRAFEHYMAEYWRLLAEREKWMSLPGREPPPIVVRRAARW